MRDAIGDRAPTPAQQMMLRRLLYGLYTLVTVHLGNEEAVFLPLLDARLTQTEAAQLFEKVEAAAAEVLEHGRHHGRR